MSTPDTAINDKTGRRPWRRLRLSEFTLPIFIVLMAAVAGFIEPKFFSQSNIMNLLRQMSPLMILAVGQAFAIISRGLDLSMASVLSLAGVAGVLVMQTHGVMPGIAVMLIIGLVTGAFSGVIIGFFQTSPLIVTLGMMSIAQALALIFSGGVPIYSVPEAYVELVGYTRVLGVPVIVIIAVATTLAGWVLLSRTVFGRYVYAVGSNPSAALKTGIRVPWVQVGAYAVSGLTAGVGAIVLTAWIGAAQPVAAPTLALEAIAAVVLGGVALTGGSGRIIHVIYGVIILGMLSNALNMIGVSDYYQTLAVGIVIIMAVILDRFRRRAALS